MVIYTEMVFEAIETYMNNLPQIGISSFTLFVIV